MKAIKTLLKLATKKHESLISKRNILFEECDNKNSDLLNLRYQIKTESENYHDSEYKIYLENFLKETKKKESVIIDDLLKLEKEINELDDQVLDNFSEIKKFEIILKNRKIKENLENLQYENKELDEISGIIYSKRNNQNV